MIRTGGYHLQLSYRLFRDTKMQAATTLSHKVRILSDSHQFISMSSKWPICKTLRIINYSQIKNLTLKCTSTIFQCIKYSQDRNSELVVNSSYMTLGNSCWCTVVKENVESVIVKLADLNRCQIYKWISSLHKSIKKNVSILLRLNKKLLNIPEAELIFQIVCIPNYVHQCFKEQVCYLEVMKQTNNNSPQSVTIG